MPTTDLPAMGSISSNTCLGLAGHQKVKEHETLKSDHLFRNFCKQPRKCFTAQNLGGSRRKEGTEESEKVFR